MFDAYVDGMIRLLDSQTLPAHGDGLRDLIQYKTLSLSVPRLFGKSSYIAKRARYSDFVVSNNKHNAIYLNQSFGINAIPMDQIYHNLVGKIHFSEDVTVYGDEISRAVDRIKIIDEFYKFAPSLRIKNIKFVFLHTDTYA